MKDAKTLALVGASLLFVGVFLPLISMPFVGSMNYFRNGQGDGTVVLVLAVGSALLALSNRTQHVLWTGIGCLGMLTFTFVRFQSAMSELEANMESELAGNPFRGLADMAVQSVQLQWGWAVLLIGGVLVTYAGWKARQEIVAE